jgi:hypothetical protein
VDFADVEFADEYGAARTDELGRPLVPPTPSGITSDMPRAAAARDDEDMWASLG